jgi:MFS family permease
VVWCGVVWCGVLLLCDKSSLTIYSCATLQGRKTAYIAALSMITLAGYGSAFARDFPTLVVMRFFVGFGVGAIHIPFDIMAEFLPSR